MEAHAFFSRNGGFVKAATLTALGAAFLAAGYVFGQKPLTAGVSGAPEYPFACVFTVLSPSPKSPVKGGVSSFAVKLPAELMKSIMDDPNAQVQFKLSGHQINGGVLEFGAGQVRLNQGVIQSQAAKDHFKKFNESASLPTNRGQIKLRE